MLWPVWMDDAGLRAKSEDFGGETLAEHTWQVLSRLGDQYRFRSSHGPLTDPCYWERMYWGCLLHDFGKAAVEFQEILQGKANRWKEWRQRHEILSLAFVDWLFPKGHPDRGWVIAIIAFHHRDRDEIFRRYGGEYPMHHLEPNERELKEAFLTHLASQIDPATRKLLWRWVSECAVAWAREIGISVTLPSLMPLDDACDYHLDTAIFRSLRDLARWETSTTETERYQLILARGLILTADHAASAGVTHFPHMPLSMQLVHGRAVRGYALCDHQQATAAAPLGSALLIAPTGSGKTEAALLWAARQLELQSAPRLFYTLPYQASMNAMYERLACGLFGCLPEQVAAGACEAITIQHGRATLKFFQDYLAWDESNTKEARAIAKRLRNQARLNLYPVQVFSPYQMLKAAYSLKGYETFLVDYTGALFIFDEIHAYDPKRLALIITLMQWLAEHFHARFLVMTATLPPPVSIKLQEALGIDSARTFHATPEDYARSRRHVVHLLDGALGASIVDRVQADWAAGRSILICLNRVACAQTVYAQLKETLDLQADNEIVLLHSRFNGEDRSRKEAILMQRTGVEHRHLRRPIVCVATQVVEVSLNVDFDTLYTDPAPLEALLQRFGRVNRGRGVAAPLCPVHVFTVPNAGSDAKHYLPYDAAMVQTSIAILSQTCADRPIDESQVNAMLRAVYQGEIAARWEADYAEQAMRFRRDVLERIIPLQSAGPERLRQFNEMFDGIDVLPEESWDPYAEALEAGGYLDASRYLVGISMQQYGEFFRYGRIKPARKEENAFADHIDAPYSAEFGLDLEAVRQAEKLGRQQPEDADDDWDD